MDEHELEDNEDKIEDTPCCGGSDGGGGSGGDVVLAFFFLLTTVVMVILMACHDGDGDDPELLAYDGAGVHFDGDGDDKDTKHAGGDVTDADAAAA